ncbi:MAG: hypothetical protein ACRYG8_09925 [Janthinobacterium lividum]
MSAPSTLPTYAEPFWDAVQRVFGNRRNGTQLLAAAAHAPVRTAEKWMQRVQVAHGDSLLALCLASPDINDAVFSAVRARISQTENRIAECRSRREHAQSVAAGVPDPGRAAGMGSGGVRGRGEQGDVGGGVGGQEVQAVTVPTVDRRRAAS